MVQCILASRQDPASATLATQLLEHPLLKTRRLFPNQIQVWKNCAVEIEGYLLERFQETKNALEIKRVPAKKSLHTTDQADSEKSAGAIPLVITNHELLFLDDIDQLINKVLTQTFEKPIIIDLLLVLSKHSSKHPFPSLSVHSIGNFEDAELGGKPNMLVPSSAKAMLFGLKAIEAAANVLQAQSNVVQAFQEVTHHGPWVSTPTIFFEIGASPKEWNDTTIANAVAEKIIWFCDQLHHDAEYTPALGIGSLHNAISLKRLSLEKNIGFSHLYPKYLLPKLTTNHILAMQEASREKITTIVLDWKSLGQEKERVLAALAPFKHSLTIIKKQ